VEFLKSKQKDTNVIVDASGPLLDENGMLTVQEVEKRRVYGEVVTTFLKDGGGGMVRVRYATCTQRGYYPDEQLKQNQDVISITPNFAGLPSDLFFAIHDGHGSDGHVCATYAKDHLPQLLTRYVRQERAKLFKERQSVSTGLRDGKSVMPFNPKLWPMLDVDGYERASRKAHLDCNTNMINDMNRCTLSGTTSISAAFHDGRFTISNVGDSRAVLGYRDPTTTTNDNSTNNINDQYEHDEVWSDDNGEEKKEIERPPTPQDHQRRRTNQGKLIALPLSVDQTPWRKDERRRIKAAGGRILTIDQIEGCRPIPVETTHTTEGEESDEFGDRILGMNDDAVDIAGDPPRVWLKDEPMPGTAYTRSLGDGIAQTVGVTAEPEMITKEIAVRMGRNDGDGYVGTEEVLVLASDGVFEFLPNQEVMDLCDKAGGCPKVACRKIMDRSYEKWVEYENRTDDISAIVIWMDSV